MISVTINGEPRDFNGALTLARLTDKLALNGKRFAVEKNGSVVPRSRFSDEFLADGDRLEIVIAVGGG